MTITVSMNTPKVWANIADEKRMMNNIVAEKGITTHIAIDNLRVASRIMDITTFMNVIRSIFRIVLIHHVLPAVLIDSFSQTTITKHFPTTC